MHCKAGLGRTGTLIGLWAQKWFRFPGRAWVGWNRIVRPGAILGPQQQFMEDMERTMWAEGETCRARLTGQPHQQRGTGSDSDNSNRNDVFSNKANFVEDVGQADRLLAARGQQKTGVPSFGSFLGNGTNPFASNTTNGVPNLGGMFGPQPVGYNGAQ